MKRLDESTWHQLKAAFVAGGSLRGLARAAKIPAGTILARCKREGWSQAKQEALQRAGLSNGLESGKVQSRAIDESIGDEMAKRAKAHVSRMAQVLETLGGHLAGMDAEAVWDGITKVDVYDKVCRRNFGLDAGERAVTVNVLAAGGYDFTPASAESFG